MCRVPVLLFSIYSVVYQPNLCATARRLLDELLITSGLRSSGLLHLLRGLAQVLGDLLQLRLGRQQRHTLGQVAFNVFQKRVQRGTRQLVKVHVPEVGSHLVLHAMLLVDVHRLQKRHPLVVRLAR